MGAMNLLKEALVVMLMGMGVVFSFLIIMVSVMTIMKPIMAFLNKIFPEEVVTTKPKKSVTSADDEIAAAIAIAISR